MAEKLDEKEVVTFKELLMSQMIQLDAVTQLLIENRLINSSAGFHAFVIPLEIGAVRKVESTQYEC